LTVAFYARHIETNDVLRRGLILAPLSEFSFKATQWVNPKYLSHGNCLYSPVVTRKFSLPGLVPGTELVNQCQDSPHLLRGHQI
jgi:hypothetical protein